MKQPPEVQTDKEVLAGGSPGKSDETAEYPAEGEGLWNLSISSSRGVTDEVATLVRDFVPTRFELQKLARLYFEEHAEYRVWWMQCGGSGMDEIRSEEFALRRLDTIGKLLTKEQMAEAIDPVKEEYDPLWAEMVDFYGEGRELYAVRTHSLLLSGCVRLDGPRPTLF